ncbi:MAG: hypothetical protein RTU30_06650 [Candidatus Thorarchaeota archaeon]
MQQMKVSKHIIGGRFQFKYNQSLIEGSGTIDRLLFHATGSGDIILENFTVLLVETPVAGRLSHTDIDSNYGGVTPATVLDQDEYIIRSSGSILVIDLDDLFYYSNTYDLLIELRFDAKISGSRSSYFTNNAGAYRMYNTTATGNDTLSYDIYIDFIYDMNTVTYSGLPFVNATTYYWRVRTCDPIGIWSPWETSSFKFEVLTSLPDWSNFMQTPLPIELGDSATVSVDVTHISGINQVLIEYEGVNHTMSNTGDTYSYTWTPSSTGDVFWVIYMESWVGTWETLAEGITVVDTTPPTWLTAPSDKVLFVGDSLHLQLNAADLSGIASWSISDDRFQIVDGLVTNLEELTLGGYYLNVTVTDTEGNSRSGTFIVAVIEPIVTTTPITTTTPTTTTSPTTSTTPSETTTTTTTQPSPTADNTMIIVALVGVIVFLVIILVVQQRKS